MFASAPSGPRPSTEGATSTRTGHGFTRASSAALACARFIALLPPTRLLIALSALLLLSSWGGAAFFAFRSHSAVIDSSRRVSAALELDEAMQRILALLDRADGAGRAFLLTQRSQYLAPYEEIAKAIPREVARLAARTGGDPLYDEGLKELASLIAERLDLVSHQIAKGAPAGDGSAFVVAMSERGIALMDAIHQLAWRMIRGEKQRLAEEQRILTERARFGSAWLRLFFGVNTVFAGATLLLAHRLSRLQRFVKVCAWSRMIEYEGQWLTFEQYLERRFKIRTSHGISPQEAARLMEQSPENFGTAGPAG